MMSAFVYFSYHIFIPNLLKNIEAGGFVYYGYVKVVAVADCRVSTEDGLVCLDCFSGRRYSWTSNDDSIGYIYILLFSSVLLVGTILFYIIK